jgi:hypothetical protein
MSTATIDDGRDAGGRATQGAVAERIGECEFCGVTDHHLVDGICPTCRPKCTTVGGNRSFIALTREAFGQLAAGAKLAVHNLTGPDDEEDRAPGSAYDIQFRSANASGAKLHGYSGTVVIDEVSDDMLGAEADVSHVRRD